mgnify:CR=1 FL=1
MIYATVGSVTTAARLAKKLSAHGDLRTSVVHTPPEINDGGCSYSVRTSLRDPAAIREIAAEYGIQIRGFYREDIFNGRKFYHVIS